MTAQPTLAITGASGFLGRNLAQLMQEKGWKIKRLVRTQPTSPDEIYWQPDEGVLNPADLVGVTAIAQLAGEGVIGKRWSEKQKAYLLANRQACSETIAKAVAAMENPPQTVLFGSGCSHYGVGTDDEMTESSPGGEGFVAQITQACEAGAKLLENVPTRVVIVRSGVVLNPASGALKNMLPAFRLGFGGPIGDGKQILSWISLSDHLHAMKFLLKNDQLDGVFNLTSPYPVTNAEFTNALAHKLHRPAVLPAHPLMLKVMFGEVADWFLVKGSRVLPERLLDNGFEFRFPEIQSALAHELKHKAD